MVWLAGLLITTLSLLKPLPAMASASNAVATVSVTSVSTLATMSNQAKAMAKDTEGKLEAAYGDATGNMGRQVKGKAKQVQASAMKTGDDLKEGAKSVAKKVDDATR